MSRESTPAAWSDELRRRYLRGEASLFVLHGNVHDSVLCRRRDQPELIGLPEFLAETVLAKKDTVIRYNVSKGCRFVKKGADIEALEQLLIQRSPIKVLPVLERLLYTQTNVGLILEYGEMLAPTGDVTLFSEQDRLAIVTLQRWSLAAELEESDNIVIVLTESPSDVHSKIVANPRVAAVKVPMPATEQRREVIKHVNPQLEEDWVAKFADVTAGLKTVQIKSILRPPSAHTEDADARFRFIKSLVNDDKRARKFAAITQGMSREEIQELIGVTAPTESSDLGQFDDVLRLIAKRKREIIERECFGLIEFVSPNHDFSVVGGMDEIKRELIGISSHIREGRTSRVPMGLLFVGPMGTGKTFVAEAFVRESGLTGIKLKNFRSKWVGSTESNLERILDVVQAIGNIIVIIDEGDRSFGSGDAGEGDGGTSSRVVARLKEFMSDTSNRGRVLFILMTNRPDKLDIDIKRAGRLDRKIPFLYAQAPEQIESVLQAQFRKHKLTTTIEFPRDRETVSTPILGLSNADLEALALLANNYAAEQGTADSPVTPELFAQAIADYLPSRDVEMLEYMELLAVFEASNRRMLSPKYADMSRDELQRRMAELRLSCAGRR